MAFDNPDAFFVTKDWPAFVQGDTPTFTYLVTLEPGRTITKAWKTAKAAPADPDPGVFQVIGTLGSTTTDVDGSTTVEVFFKLTSLQSAAAPAGTQIGYDVQLLLDNGDIRTPVKGHVQAEAGYTTATS